MHITIRLSLPVTFVTLFLVGSTEVACPIGDLTGDCEVNLPDLQAFGDQWLDGECSGPNCADLDGLNGVDTTEFARLAENWRRAANPLVINEFMASNGSTLESMYYIAGQWRWDYPDWIEIYNCSALPVDVGGKYLTDDLNDPGRWRFPEGTTIDPYRYLVVFASGNGPGVVDFHGRHHLRDSGRHHILFAQRN
jgi:hypothetical protein